MIDQTLSVRTSFIFAQGLHCDYHIRHKKSILKLLFALHFYRIMLATEGETFHFTLLLVVQLIVQDELLKHLEVREALQHIEYLLVDLLMTILEQFRKGLHFESWHHLL